MSARCHCCGICGCNTACCCFFKIPVDFGYALCCIWLMFNGFMFPLFSFVFWPKYYIFYGSCFVCAVNTFFSCISLMNMWFNVRKIYSAVLYGIFIIYLSGGFMITICVNIDLGKNSELMIASLKSKLNISVDPSAPFRILQIIQIMFYTYLFASYVYCGFVLQLYEIKHDKRYRKVRH